MIGKAVGEVLFGYLSARGADKLVDVVKESDTFTKLVSKVTRKGVFICFKT